MSVPSRRALVGLAIGLGLFLFVIGYIVASSMVPRDVVEYPVSVRTPRPQPPQALVTDTITLDATDDRNWRFFDFATGAARELPDTNGWDLAFRRFHVIASGGAADLGARAFGDVTDAPDGGYLATTVGGDTVNPALDRWYDYSFLSHVLESNGHVYAVRTADGFFAKLRFLGYYCPGTAPGCITFEYAYQGDGSRRLR